MNYRHGFHAGNFADVMKHALLARILTHLAAKDTPLRVIDLHAGAGLYDLASEEATRTGEWRDGIGRLNAAPLQAEAEALLAPYRAAIAAARRLRGANTYPGSPFIARFLTRPQDRLLTNELNPRTRARLEAALASDARCRILGLDASVALRANIPPRERRGLVLIDPPFERRDEFARLVEDLTAALAKWPTGVYAVWYPANDAALADGFVAALLERGLARLLRLELAVHDRAEGMGASGLLVVNPPWKLRPDAEVILPALAERLATAASARYRCDAIRPDG